MRTSRGNFGKELQTSPVTDHPTVTAELFVIPNEGRHLVYAPLRRAAFLAGADVVNRIVDLQEGTADLSDASVQGLLLLLRHLNIVDGDPEVPPITSYAGVPHPTTVTLFLTTACNLRCTYCYAAAGDTPKKTMSLAVARQGIDFVIANAQNSASPAIEIIYHGGGEPTINWGVLTGSFHYAWQRTSDVGLELRAGMATNGYLPPQKAEWSIQHLNSINVSVDGLPEVHDAHRPTVSGIGSSHRVMETLRRFDEADFTYTVRLTVTSDEISRLPSSVRYLCDHCRPAKIQVEPVFAIGRWKDAPAVDTHSFVENFRAAQKVARTYGRELYFSPADLTAPSNHFCGVSQDSFALTADGNVSACYEVFMENLPRSETFLYGDYDIDRQTFRFDLPVLNNLRDQTVDKHEFCGRCFAKWSCSGDCYHKSLTAIDVDEFAGSGRCHIVRELTKDQILHNIAASGGLYWLEPLSESRPRECEFGLGNAGRQASVAEESGLAAYAPESAASTTLVPREK